MRRVRLVREAGTRRVQLVREGAGGGGGYARHAAQQPPLPLFQGGRVGRATDESLGCIAQYSRHGRPAAAPPPPSPLRPGALPSAPSPPASNPSHGQPSSKAFDALWGCRTRFHGYTVGTWVGTTVGRGGVRAGLCKVAHLPRTRSSASSSSSTSAGSSAAPSYSVMLGSVFTCTPRRALSRRARPGEGGGRRGGRGRRLGKGGGGGSRRPPRPEYGRGTRMGNGRGGGGGGGGASRRCTCSASSTMRSKPNSSKQCGSGKKPSAPRASPQTPGVRGEGRGVSDWYGVRDAACPLSTRGGGGRGGGGGGRTSATTAHTLRPARSARARGARGCARAGRRH